jgi:peptide-methionine (S)-S-oxide reductase
MANIQEITLAGGCFWCIESAFNRVKGVHSAFSGYSNGQALAPTYESVCSGDTGHAEVVRVTFDEDIISLEAILEIFFALHDPTQLNRQGNDVGTQYRGGIYYHSDAQREVVMQFIAKLRQDEIYAQEIVTEVLPVDNYHQAEDYHQDYFNNNSGNTYCNFVVGPKLAKFKQTFAHYLKEHD